MHAQVFKCYKKEDTLKQHPFAVKISRESDEEKKMAHINEFKITQNLNHKNVVKSVALFDNQFKGEIHQVLEFVEGKEVLDMIAEQKDGHYTEDHAKNLFKQVLEGIDYLHSQDVAHRDIKP